MGIGFLIIFAGLCYLFYQYTTAPYREEAALHDEKIRQYKKQRTVTIGDPSASEQVTDSNVGGIEQNAKKPIKDTSSTIDKAAPHTTETVDTEDTSVSPFGFGPYPEVPEDYPYPVHWDKDYPTFELLTRVRIKLWTQGIDAEGVTYGRGGLIYPVIRGVAYVTRSGDRIAGVVLSHPDDDLGVFDAFWDAETPEELEAALEREDQGFTLDDLPAGLTAVDYDTAGIDPYQFLELPRR